MKKWHTKRKITVTMTIDVTDFPDESKVSSFEEEVLEAAARVFGDHHPDDGTMTITSVLKRGDDQVIWSLI